MHASAAFRHETGADGLPVLRAGLWTLDKHFHLRRYMSIFTTGMKRLWAERVYVDLLAGPGICRLEDTNQEVPGSPLLALDTRFGFTQYFFNDADPAFREALASRCRQSRDSRIHLLNQDCNVAARTIRSMLPERSLDLAFIDPFSWEIRFDSIVELTRGRRMDLVITFHSGSIKRAADYEPEALHDFFGGRSWKDEYDRSRRTGRREGTRVLLDSYEANLRRVGYRYLRDYVLVRNSQGTPLYHLLFATRHRRGQHFWDEVSSRDRRGQIRLL